MITPRVNSSVLGLALLGLAAGVAIAAEAATNKPPGEEVLISSLNVSRIEQGWGEGRSNRSVGNQKLTVAGRIWASSPDNLKRRLAATALCW